MNKNLLFLLIFVFFPNCKQANEYAKPTQLPEGAIPVLYINGEPGDQAIWQKVQPQTVLSGALGEVYDSTDLSAKLYMGWNDSALLVRLLISDDTLFLTQGSAWQKDGVEIFISPASGSKKHVQYAITPGEEETPAVITRDIDTQRAHTSSFHSTMHETGYTITGVIPFAVFQTDDTNPDLAAIQVFVNDIDNGQDKKTIMLAPLDKTYLNPFAFKSIALVTNPVAYPEISIRSHLINDSLIVVSALAEPLHTGDTLTILSGKSIVSSLIFANTGRFAQAADTLLYESFTSGKTIHALFGDNLIEEIPLSLVPKIYTDSRRNRRFDMELNIFSILDNQMAPSENATVVTGSSSIRMWHTIHHDLAPVDIIHRGFGGSTAKDLLQNLDSLVLKYNPDTILIYEGDNDMMGETTVNEFISANNEILSRIDSALPEAFVYFISIKPSPSRAKVMHKIDEANKKLQEIAQRNNKVGFINVSDIMINEAGKIKPEIFLSDSVHMNEDGYALWTKVFRDHLIKN